jgi:hypothetical protein
MEVIIIFYGKVPHTQNTEVVKRYILIDKEILGFLSHPLQNEFSLQDNSSHNFHLQSTSKSVRIFGSTIGQ